MLMKTAVANFLSEIKLDEITFLLAWLGLAWLGLVDEDFCMGKSIFVGDGLTFRDMK